MTQPKIITIPTASSGRIQVDAAHSTLVQLGFDPNAASVERSDNDLVFTLDNGAVFDLKDFFVTDGADLPNLQLPDGTEVASTDLLTALNSYMDITTAAGPATSGSSGINDYIDHAGDLLGGTDRLGDLDSIYWEKSIEGSNRLEIASLGGMAAAAGSSGGDGGGDGGGVTPPLPANFYDARMVLHRPLGDDSDQVYCQVLDKENKPVVPGTDFDYSTVSVAGGFFKVDVYDPTTGRLTLKLTADGTSWLRDNPGTNLYDYITITHGGREYTVQVQVNQDGNFNSEIEDLSGDMTFGEGKLIHGEWHQGKNLVGANITSSDGDDTIYFAGNIIASDIDAGKGSNTIIVGGLRQDSGRGSTITSGGGTITVNDGQAGMLATANATNTISAGAGIVKITAEGNIVTYGLYADGGDNKVSGKEVEIIATCKYGVAYGLYATGGTNEVSSLGDMTITVNDSRNAYGLHATDTGKNILESESGTITIETKSDSGSIGVYADASTPLGTGEFHNSIISKYGDINISVEKNPDWPWGGNRTGVGANAGSNKLEALEGTIKISVSADSSARGVYANSSERSGGRNEVNAKSIDITVTGGQGQEGYKTTADGLLSDGINTQNKITFTDEMKIIAQNAKSVSGIRASSTGVGFGNFIDGGGGVLTINALDGRHASGMHSFSGHNEVTNIKELTINVTSLKYRPNESGVSPGAFGLYSASKGSNTIDMVKGTVEINVGNVLGNTNTNNAYGMCALGNTAWNKLSSAGGKIIMDVRGNKLAIGLSADSGSNIIEGKANVTMDVHGNEVAMGLYSNGGSNLIESKADVTMNVSGKKAYGMYAKNSDGENIIDGAKAVNLTVDGLGDGTTAYGMFTDYGEYSGPAGLNSIEKADSVTITVEKAANAYGMYAKGSGGRNTIEGISGNVTLNVTGKDISYAMYAESGGTNTIAAGAGKVEIIATGSDFGITYGLYASGGTNTISAGAGKVEIIATSGSNNAYGLYAKGSGGTNTITANTMDIGAKIVDGDSASKAVAMYAEIGGVNTLSSNAGHNLTLIITAKAGSLDKAYAMLASGKGINQIIGHSLAGQEGKDADNITIAGKIEAQGSGKNIIETGAGNDIINITGKIEAKGGGENIIKTGAGNDTINITGKIEAQGSGKNIIETGAGNDIVNITGSIIDGNIYGGGNFLSTGDGDDRVTLNMKEKVSSKFKLDMGTDDDGQDVDILTIIAPAGMFEDFYSDWLTELLKDSKHGIEEINVIGYTNDNDFLWLQTIIDNYNSLNPGKTIDLTKDYDPSLAAPFSLQEEFDDALESAAASVSQGEEAENNTLITMPELADTGALFGLSGLDLASDTEDFEPLFGSEADLSRTIDAANISAPELIAENNTLITMPELADTATLFDDLTGLDISSDTEDFASDTEGFEPLFRSEADLSQTIDAANISASSVSQGEEAENNTLITMPEQADTATLFDLFGLDISNDTEDLGTLLGSEADLPHTAEIPGVLAATLKENGSDQSDYGQSTARYINTEFQTADTHHDADETALLIHLTMGT